MVVLIKTVLTNTITYMFGTFSESPAIEMIENELDKMGVNKTAAAKALDISMVEPTTVVNSGKKSTTEHAEQH